MTSEQLIQAVRALRPGAALSHEPGLGVYTLRTENGQATIDTWHCGGTPPTAAELAAWEAREVARANLRQAHAMLGESYTLAARALARGDAAAAAEIQDDIADLLDYIQEAESAA